MVKLIAPNGAVVDVAEEKAERLTDQGYTAEKKAPAKKAASSKSEK